MVVRVVGKKSKSINRQIEQILDENSNRNQQVLIQLADDDDSGIELYEAAAKNLHNRTILGSPRDMLPPSCTELRRIRRLSRRDRQKNISNSNSISQMAVNMRVSPKAAREAKSDSLKNLKRFVSDSHIKGAIDNRWKNSKVFPEKAYHELWAAKTVAMDIHRDDLHSLVDEMSGIAIANVFPNRNINLPPIAKMDVSRLPSSVTDNKTSAWGVEAIGAMSVWGAYDVRGEGVKVAVLDTGIDASHPDLIDSFDDRYYVEFDRDGNAIYRAPRDTHTHGTHCAGTIAGGNASGQWIGVAPEATLMAGTVLPRGQGSDFQILAGMQWAIDNGADIISMSLGSLSFDPRVLDVYTRMVISANQLGIPVVVAIGNDGSQTSGSPGNDYFSYTVGATDPLDRVAGFSGGRTQYIDSSQYINKKYLPLVYSKPDISAPGVGVLSSIPRGKYEAYNGSSMATPHVAGALALLLSGTNIRDTVPANERAYLLQDLLNGSVEDVGEAGQDHRFGVGRLNVLRAMGYARELGYID